MKTKLFALAGLALVAVACNKENAPQINENGRVTVSFNANPSTKVVYTEDAAGEYYNIDWSPNEEVGLVAVDVASLQSIHTKPFKFTQDHGNVFIGEVELWGDYHRITAVWPYDCVSRLGTLANRDFSYGHFSVPGTMTIPAGSDEYGHTMLVAASDGFRTYDHIGSLVFHQVYSIVKMNITGVPADAKVDKVTVSSSGQISYTFNMFPGGYPGEWIGYPETATVHNSLQFDGYVDGLTCSYSFDFKDIEDYQMTVPGVIFLSSTQLDFPVSGAEIGQDCVVNLPLIETKSLMEYINESGDTYKFTVTLSDGSTFEKTLTEKVMFEMGHVYKLNMPLQ